MKISLVQENPVVGDIEGNASIARDYILKFESSGSDLIVFSELFITGYPPEDLLLREDFLISAQKEVENLSSTIKKSKVLILGFSFKENCNDLRNTQVINLYKLLKENNVDTAELEGKAIHPQSGEVKLGEVTDDEKRTLGMDVMEYIKAMPRDLVVSVTRGGMNGFDFVNDVVSFLTYGNRKVPEDSVFKFIDERIEAQKKSLNELDKDDPLTTRIIAAVGQDAAFVYPIYKKVKSIGIPKQYALPVSFALGSTFAFDKKMTFFLDTEAIRGLNYK